MILRKLTLTNFRQFRGTQQIEFANVVESDNQKVTVIFGENGRGKTGIFRAIIFCLFGERRLSQDGDVPNSELQLVNVSALEESAGKPVRASVELEFSHKGYDYNLKRTMCGIRESGSTFEEFDEARLIQTDSDGNSKIVEPIEVDEIVNSILDRRVKDYFLFDGEKIERLTRASIEQRREIGKGIRNLLNVDALEISRKAAARLTRDLENELRKNASPEYAKLLKQLDDAEQAEKSKKKRLEDIGDEVSAAQKEKHDIDKKLEDFKEIRELVEKRKITEQNLKDLEQQAADHLSKMKNLSGKTAVLFIAPSILKVFKHIEHQKQKGEIPSEIRKDLIERILSEKQCICGNEICEGTEAHSRILEWLNRTSDMTIQDSALDLWRHLSEVQSHFEDYSSHIENQLLSYVNIRGDIDAARDKLEALRKEIGTSERQDASKLDDHRKRLEEKLVKLEAENQVLQSQLTELKGQKNQFLAQLKEEKLRQGRHDELTRRATLAREIRDALDDVYESFTEEIKILIGQKASELFHQLLDEEGRENLRTIIVDQDYSLQVLDRWNRPFLANISAGQRQIMSISFIAALAHAASNNALFEMPLFMDTPFGRLSSEHRKNLIRLIPDFSSQWILLATDTEFRRQEARLLKNGKKWGKFYLLKSDKAGNTKIEEREVKSVHAILKDEDEIQ